MRNYRSVSMSLPFSKHLSLAIFCPNFYKRTHLTDWQKNMNPHIDLLLPASERHIIRKSCDIHDHKHTAEWGDGCTLCLNKLSSVFVAVNVANNQLNWQLSSFNTRKLLSSALISRLQHFLSVLVYHAEKMYIKMNETRSIVFSIQSNIQNGDCE